MKIVQKRGLAKKKILLILLGGCMFLSISENCLFSQELGAKAGIVRSHANISGFIPWLEFQPINEFSAGIYFNYDVIGGQLGFQSEINYVIKGFDAVEQDLGETISSKYKIQYLEIPLLITYKVPLKGRIKPGVVFGPYFGIPLKVMEVQTAFGETEKRELDDNLKNTDFGLVFGANVRYILGSVNLILDVQYNLGLTNISNDITEVAYEFFEDDTIKNRALTFTLGLGFNLF
jgi:hypothetical protein